METAQNRPGEPRDGRVTVRVAPDRMAAFLVVEGPENGGNPVTVAQAQQKLQEAGVAYGLDPAAVERAVASQGAADLTVQVAAGKPPQPGEDGTLAFHPILSSGGRPQLREDGSVDLYDLGVVHSVTEGTVLCTRTPPTPGEPGINVMGQEVPARPGREPRLHLGKGVAWDEEKRKVVATTDGHAALVRDTLSVNPVYTVVGDVGPGSGNIHFVGSVVVKGNVFPGFVVQAEGSVEIHGGIDGGIVEAGGDVTVRYGIQGGGRGRVEAGGNVKAKFIENGNVAARGNIWVADGILHSRVQAGGKVEVLGRRGAIVGGRIAAREAVTAKVVGAAMGTPTEIAVGLLPSLRQEMEQVRHRLAEVEEQLSRTVQGLKLLQEQERRGVLGPGKVKVIRRLAQAQAQLVAERDQLTARRTELEEALQDSRHAWVVVQHTCHPGVRVTIGTSLYVVTDPLTRTRFTLNDDREVSIGPV